MNDDNDRALMAANAMAFAEEAKKMLEETMRACQMEAFQGTEFNIPFNINTPIAQGNLSQEQIWEQINQLYNSQTKLFDDSLEPTNLPAGSNSSSIEN